MAHTSETLQAAFKYLFIEEVQALKELARSLPPNPIVVNIGAGAGTSGLAFVESRPDLHLITVDIQYEDSPFGCLTAEQNILRAANYGYPYDDRYYQIQGDSITVGLEWQKRRPLDVFRPVADMVFIDGDHSYKGCKGDILAWLPNIKPGGIIAVHDYGKKAVYSNGPIDNAPHPLPWPGVDRAVRKFLLCQNYELILHVKTLIAFRV